MRKPIKVLQVFGSLNIGGAESRMMDIYRELDESVIAFDFLTMDTSTQFFEHEIIKSGGKVIKIPSPRISGVGVNLINIINVIKENGPYKAVHAHTSFHCGLVMFAAFFMRVPIRITHARTISSNNKNLMSKLSFYIGKLLIKLFATERLAITEAAARYLFDKRDLRNDRVQILPNAINLDKFTNVDVELLDNLRSKLKVNNNQFVIGHVGRFEKMKNQKFLIDLMPELLRWNKNTLVLFVGTGPQLEELRKYVKLKKLERHIYFLGVRCDVNALMAIFDVLVMPSIYEGLCGVAIEAQASGTPCVLSLGIPREVDLGLGLIEFLSLTDDSKIWVKTIIKQRSIKIPSKEDILETFHSKNYTIQDSMSRLIDIYTKSQN